MWMPAVANAGFSSQKMVVKDSSLKLWSGHLTLQPRQLRRTCMWL